MDRSRTNSRRSRFRAPWNQFGYARELLELQTEFVSPNNDTLYVLAACDVPGTARVARARYAQRLLRASVRRRLDEQFRLHRPRRDGTSEGEFLLSADGWTGEAPAGMRSVSSPTRILMIVGRRQVDGETDLPAVHALQDVFTITPLSVPGRRTSFGYARRSQAGSGWEALQWWERLRVALVSFLPGPADARLIEFAASFDGDRG